TDYHLLRNALIKEFADPESEQELVAALETKQGRNETPQAYYSRLRRAYFGARNEPNMEEDLNFKTIFLRNLHPGTMTSQQLRDLAHKAYGKQKKAAEKGTKSAAVLDLTTQMPTTRTVPSSHLKNEDHPRPTENETLTEITTGMDSVDDKTHLDATRRNPGTIQDPILCPDMASLKAQWQMETHRFWTIPVHPDDQHKLAFTFGNRQFAFMRCPFSYANSPAEFNIFLNKACPDARARGNIIYVDDLLLKTVNVADHLKEINHVLNQLTTAGAKIALHKGQWCKK
ncbi:hypothetical protein M9458_048705, partial [Cirrhinus mrigala]